MMLFGKLSILEKASPLFSLTDAGETFERRLNTAFGPNMVMELYIEKDMRRISDGTDWLLWMSHDLHESIM